MIVVDASAFGPLILPDEAHMVLPGLHEQMAFEEAVVPAHWRLELGNLLLIAKRRGRITDDDQEVAANTLSALVVDEDRVADSSPGSAAWRLAEKHRLSMYDAVYLDLALRRRLPLATNDRTLARAAEAEELQLFGR